jgi:hypothetical protein
MKILGIDPGVNGGLAIVLVNGDGMAQLIDAIWPATKAQSGAPFPDKTERSL